MMCIVRKLGTCRFFSSIILPKSHVAFLQTDAIASRYDGVKVENLRDNAKGLLHRLYNLSKERATEMEETESSASVSTYIDPERAAREVELLFKRRPLIVAHGSELAEQSQYVSADACDVPLLVTRGKDDKLRAFLNVCRHRGTRLVKTGSGKAGKKFVCPYHAWAYEADTGKLAFVPGAKGFNSCATATKRDLVPLPLLKAGGFVFVTPNATLEKPVPTAEEFLGDALLGDLESLDVGSHTIFDRRSFRRSLNWKLVVESALENYHVKYAHRATIAPMFPDNIGAMDEMHPSGHLRMFSPKRSMRKLTIEDLERPNPLATLRKHTNIVYFIFPNTILLVQPDHVSCVTMYPEGTDQTLFHFTTLIPSTPTSEKERAYWQKNVDLTYEALDEDWDLGESIQKGLRSGANTSLTFGRFEALLGSFNATVDREINFN